MSCLSLVTRLLSVECNDEGCPGWGTPDPVVFCTFSLRKKDWPFTSREP